MNFLGMGPMELMVILVLALIIFGPGKLPEIAGQVGKVVRDFRRTTSRAVQRVQPDAEPRRSRSARRPRHRRRQRHAPYESHAARRSPPRRSPPVTPPPSDRRAAQTPFTVAAAPAAGRRRCTCRVEAAHHRRGSRPALLTRCLAVDSGRPRVGSPERFTALRAGCTIPLASP